MSTSNNNAQLTFVEESHNDTLCRQNSRYQWDVFDNDDAVTWRKHQMVQLQLYSSTFESDAFLLDFIWSILVESLQGVL